MNSNDPARLGDEVDHDAETVSEQPVDPVDQMLVAYLDGELDDAETVEVESKLAGDSTLRLRLHELQASWDMLDELPRNEPGQAFLKSTIEMVVTSAEKKKVKWHRWPLRILATVAAFGVMSLVAFQVVRSWQTAPYRNFVAELDFLENTDMYDLVEEIEFLEQLHQKQIFSDGDSSVETPTLTNQERFEQLSSFELNEVISQQNRFSEKSPETQESRLHLHQEIQAHPDRDKLLATMTSYSNWVQAFNTDYKAEFRARIKPMSIEKKIEHIQLVSLRRAEDQFGMDAATQLPAGDVSAIGRWSREFVKAENENIVELLKKTQGSDRQAEIDSLTKSGFQRFAFMILASNHEELAINMIRPDHFVELEKILSKEALNILSDQADIQAKKKLVCRWTRVSLDVRSSVELPGAREIARFYDEELTDEQKARANQMLPDARMDQILNWYRYRNRDLPSRRRHGGRRAPL